MVLRLQKTISSERGVRVPESQRSNVQCISSAYLYSKRGSLEPLTTLQREGGRGRDALWEFYMVYFDHIYPPLSQLLPDPPTLSLPSQLCVLIFFFFFNPSFPFVLPIYSWVYRQPTRGHILKKTAFPFPAAANSQ